MLRLVLLVVMLVRLVILLVNAAPSAENGSLVRAACLAISAQAAGARTGRMPSASGMMMALVVLVAALVALVFEQVLE